MTRRELEFCFPTLSRYKTHYVCFYSILNVVECNSLNDCFELTPKLAQLQTICMTCPLVSLGNECFTPNMQVFILVKLNDKSSWYVLEIYVLINNLFLVDQETPKSCLVCEDGQYRFVLSTFGFGLICFSIWLIHHICSPERQ